MVRRRQTRRYTRGGYGNRCGRGNLIDPTRRRSADGRRPHKSLHFGRRRVHRWTRGSPDANAWNRSKESNVPIVAFITHAVNLSTPEGPPRVPRLPQPRADAMTGVASMPKLKRLPDDLRSCAFATIASVKRGALKSYPCYVTIQGKAYAIYPSQSVSDLSASLRYHLRSSLPYEHLPSPSAPRLTRR